MTTASAPAKVILLGEHAAVYGNPVLVAAVDLRTYAEVEKSKSGEFTLTNKSTNIKNLKFRFSDLPGMKAGWATVLTAEAIEKTYGFLDLEKSDGLNIKLKSDIPVSSGLGSSASAASAMVLAIAEEFGRKITKEEIAKIAWDIENIVHGKSSGVDPFAVTHGGVIRYRKGEGKTVRVKRYPDITIAHTGIRSDTKESVAEVMKLKDEFPLFFGNYLKAMRDVVDSGQRALENGDLEMLGKSMNICHGMLSSIGVSCAELDGLVWAARKKSQGAKLCGSGRGGIMMALGDVSNELKRAGGKVIKTEICEEGVRLED
ncbi:MAG: mevalonate kinase [Candidatus Altiarchaeales archaeon IMC4]|nr:MAG: mevalonate kinase [Candidatus Altiarchaeales archaeon IMC4]